MGEPGRRPPPHSDFQPLAGSLASALPYCDLFLPAHSLTGLRRLLLVLAVS